LLTPMSTDCTRNMVLGDINSKLDIFQRI
jgi:hypothetical protein